MKRNQKYYLFFIIILACLGFGYWFFQKFFPSETGIWSPDQAQEEDSVFNYGWENNDFWTSFSFPGEQNVCINFNLKSSSRKDIKDMTVQEAPRAFLYPITGQIDTLLSKFNLHSIDEKMEKDQSLILANLKDRIHREDKNIFVLGEKKKFLIPTTDILKANFANIEIPTDIDNATEISNLEYSDKLLNYPDGFLVSHKGGVFLFSKGNLYLIQSPEIFEAMGYNWGNVKEISDFESRMDPYATGNFINFISPHPNGTILKNNNRFFFVWESKLYELSQGQLSDLFPNQPVIEVGEKELKAQCNTKNNIVSCCLNDYDPRQNPPKYFPFYNTLKWKTSGIIPEQEVKKIGWKAAMTINKENFVRRLGSFKNYILYTSGILK